MSSSAQISFAGACSELVGQVAANPSLATTLLAALTEERLSPDSGPLAINSVLKGYSGAAQVKRLLAAWRQTASHLTGNDVARAVEAGLSCYQLAQSRAHAVDAVWTGPEVSGSELRRTEAVVKEVIDGARDDLLIVGYWLVASTEHVKELIELVKSKARAGVEVRFVFDASQKGTGPDNFDALQTHWPAGLEDAPRTVYSWTGDTSRTTNRSGQEYNRKLHAKVIVADRRDALVTSANLTHAGLLENLEMGLRIEGQTALSIVRHFELLVGEQILERI